MERWKKWGWWGAGIGFVMSLISAVDVLFFPFLNKLGFIIVSPLCSLMFLRSGDLGASAGFCAFNPIFGFLTVALGSFVGAMLGLIFKKKKLKR